MREPDYLEPLFPDRNSGEHLAVQLARRLRASIENGTIPPGMRMLGSRQLARCLGLGRNTVALAFEQLVSEGYLEARPASGTFVANARFLRARPASPLPSIPPPRRTRAIAELRIRFASAMGAGPLRPGTPALHLFPMQAWQRAARVTFSSAHTDLGYASAHGTHALRAAIANHIRQFRGVSATADNVIVVEGAQAGLALISTVLAAAGDPVAIEDPCYPLARAAFELRGLNIRPVAVDDDGMDPQRLPQSAKLIFTTPTHQYPLGGTMPLERRLELLECARKLGAYIIEDDYDSEFATRVRPLPSLQSLDRSGRVIYLGTFSKALAPGLRVGYLIVPPPLMPAFRAARATTSLGVALHTQLTLAKFIDSGDLARHIRKMNGVYERNRAALANALQPLLGKRFLLGPMQIGLHVALLAQKPFSDTSMQDVVEGQRLVALSPLALKRRDIGGFLLGFSHGTEREIASSAAALVETLRSRPRDRQSFAAMG